MLQWVLRCPYGHMDPLRVRRRLGHAGLLVAEGLLLP